MSDSVGKIHLDLETNYGPFQSQLNNIAGKSTNMVTSAFSKMGKVFAGAFAVTKLVQFGKECINLASDLQEVQNVVDVVFGQSAETINNFAKSALTAYGLSELSAKRYASTMGAMLKSMGLTNDAVVSMSQSITALAGDMASFYNLSSDDAFNKIRSGISGETEPLKQLGINMSVANMEAFALSQGITKSYQSMTQAEQAMLRYNYLLSTTADAQGDFARTSDSWANQTRILTEQLNSLKSVLGSAFMAALTPVIKVLNFIIQKILVAAAYLKAFIEALTGVKSGTTSVSTSFDDTAEGLDNVAGSVEDAGNATADAAKKANKALASFDRLNVLTQNDSSSGGGSGGSGGGGSAEVDLGLSALTDIAIPEPDVSGVENAVAKAKQFFEDFRIYITTAFAPTIESWGNAFANLKEPLTNSFNSMSESVAGFWGDTLVPFGTYLVGDFIPSVSNSFSETFAPIFSEVMAFAFDQFAKDFDFACKSISAIVADVLQPAFESVKTIAIDAFGSVKKQWDDTGNTLLTKFGEFRDSIKEIWNNLYENILKPVWQSIIDAIDTLWDKHLKRLWESFLSFTSKVGEALLTVWNNFLAPLINWILEVFGPTFVDIFNMVKDAVINVVGKLIDNFSGFLDFLGGLMDFITGVFSLNWEKAWNGIKTMFESLWNGLVGAVKSPINQIIGFINTMVSAVVSAVNTVIRALNTISVDVPDWVPGIGGETFGFNLNQITAPKIPYLAKGGIIDQPTLAMVGERGKEAVVPLEDTAFADSIANAILKVLTPLFNNKDGISNNSGNPSVIVLKVGDYELGRVSVNAINKYHNLIGKVELEV